MRDRCLALLGVTQEEVEKFVSQRHTDASSAGAAVARTFQPAPEPGALSDATESLSSSGAITDWPRARASACSDVQDAATLMLYVALQAHSQPLPCVPRLADLATIVRDIHAVQAALAGQAHDEETAATATDRGTGSVEGTEDWSCVNRARDPAHYQRAVARMCAHCACVDLLAAQSADRRPWAPPHGDVLSRGTATSLSDDAGEGEGNDELLLAARGALLDALRHCDMVLPDLTMDNAGEVAKAVRSTRKRLAAHLAVLQVARPPRRQVHHCPQQLSDSNADMFAALKQVMAGGLDRTRLMADALCAAHTGGSRSAVPPHTLALSTQLMRQLAESLDAAVQEARSSPSQ